MTKRARRLAGVLMLGLTLAACAERALSPDEAAALNREKSSIVLMRIVGEAERGEPPEIWGTTMGYCGLRLGLGDFESAGAPKQRSYRFLSQEARAEGWITFTLAPGYYYLAIQRPFYGISAEPIPLFAGLPLWRIEVPPETPVVYAGTLHLFSVPKLSLFGGQFNIDYGATRVDDEHEAAVKVAHRDVPSLPQPLTRLAQRQTGPLLLGVPAPPQVSP